MKYSEQCPTKPQTLHPVSNDNTAQSSSQDVSPLVIGTINEETNIKVYPHCVIFTPEKVPAGQFYPQKTRRAKISTFSKRSRFRLFQVMAKIKSHLLNKPFFVSLTYHHGHECREISDKTVLHNFLVSMRDYDPDIQYIWRIELQERGAPHYHLIIFPSVNLKLRNRDVYSLTISAIWHRVADPFSRVHKEYGCNVQNIVNYRHACAYINKYLAKTPAGVSDLEIGKHWGCSRNLPFNMFEKVKLSRMSSVVVIRKLRLWMIKNGKEKYVDEIYFNEDRSQTVFIDAKDFYKIMGDDLKLMDFSCL